MIYSCKRCNFLFERTTETVMCPNCNRDTALPADPQEQETYINSKKAPVEQDKD